MYDYHWLDYNKFIFSGVQKHLLNEFFTLNAITASLDTVPGYTAEDNVFTESLLFCANILLFQQIFFFCHFTSR